LNRLLSVIRYDFPLGIKPITLVPAGGGTTKEFQIMAVTWQCPSPAINGIQEAKLWFRGDGGTKSGRGEFSLIAGPSHGFAC
jgi:hypothetical protein